MSAQAQGEDKALQPGENKGQEGHACTYFHAHKGGLKCTECGKVTGIPEREARPPVERPTPIWPAESRRRKRR